MAYLNKVIKVGKSSETGAVEYTVELYRTESWKNTQISNKDYAVLKFKKPYEMIREKPWHEIFNNRKIALISTTFDFNKPLIVSLDKYQ